MGASTTRAARPVLLGVFFLAGVAAVFGSSWLTKLSAQSAPQMFGAFGPEGKRLREQFWVVPGADADTPLRATMFRPSDDAPLPEGAMPASMGGTTRRPLVIINHGTDESTRHAVSLPVFYWLSRWFVERGYVVILPQRRGHGATGGPLAEGGDFCRDPEHYRAGVTAAADIAAVLAYMREQPFVDPDRAIVVGISTGGWASLALAARNPPGLTQVVNFAGGRGGHAYGRSGDVCARSRLIEAAGVFGRTARVPTLWLYSSNDSFFGPDLAKEMAAAFRGQGGPADLHILPAYGADGHALADDHAGWNLWGAKLERFLRDDSGSLQAHGRRVRAGL